MQGEVGIDGQAHARATLRLITSGCLLGERTADPSLGGIAIAVAGELKPSRDYDDAENDEALADALFAAADQLDEVFRSYADALRGFGSPRSALHSGHLRDWLVAALGDGLGVRLLRAFGFASDVARALCDARGAGADRFVPDLGIGLLGGAGASSGADGRRPARAVHPTAHARLFPALGGPPMTLAEIDAQIERSGSVRWCKGPVPEGVTVAGVVLLPDDDLLKVLARVFGEAKLRDATAEIGELAAAAMHEFRTPEAVEVPGDLPGRVSVEGEGFAGVLAAQLDAAAPLPEGARAWPSHARVRILRRRRPLATEAYPCPSGRCAERSAPTPSDRTVRGRIDDPETSGRIGGRSARPRRRRLRIRGRIASLPTRRRRAAVAFCQAAAAPFPRAIVPRR